METNEQVIPFGKYKGQPLEFLQQDKEYLKWLLEQSWFRTQYQSLFNVVINNFQEPHDTPEHNKIQVMFLDKKFVKKFQAYCGRIFYSGNKEFKLDDKNKPIIKFESDGIDVVIGYVYCINITGSLLKKGQEMIIEKQEQLLNCERLLLEPTSSHKSKFELWMDGSTDTLAESIQKYKEEINELEIKINKIKEEGFWDLSHRRYLAIEIKPQISDDFPTVLRQIKRWDSHGIELKILLVGQYTGVGATREQFISFFQNEGINVVFLNEIEAIEL